MLLLETLQSLELELHRPEVRSNRNVLDRLLHPEFREFGRSGHIYERAEVLAEFADPPKHMKFGRKTSAWFRYLTCWPC